MARHGGAGSDVLRFLMRWQVGAMTPWPLLAYHCAACGQRRWFRFPLQGHVGMIIKHDTDEYTQTGVVLHDPALCLVLLGSSLEKEPWAVGIPEASRADLFPTLALTSWASWPALVFRCWPYCKVYIIENNLFPFFLYCDISTIGLL